MDATLAACIQHCTKQLGNIEIRGIQIGMEKVKLSLFAGTLIQGNSQKLLKLINKCTQGGII